MRQKLLNYLSLLIIIEYELLSNLDYENVIDYYVNEKARKKLLNST